ncbi:uracil-DNA glycosylase [Nisaea acidiphila]|uniref:Type-4 uracil-DNA glycosylase n=1 Tax=Nisaea acidiphila TaxID=1862145 RepID=A0A9J7ALY3_9PROT|nr:uracil-DNA glycosylase [Nisaea acidiphila]UUX47970.1 uracil-DNA glycosylase [Nisaea acidiphila]
MSLSLNETEPAPEALLQLYVEWGADEAISEETADWFAAAGKAETIRPVPADPPHVSISQQTPTAPAEAPKRAPSVPEPPSDKAARALAGTAQTLEELRAALESLEGFPLKVTATNLVFGEGVERPEVMFIGEAPGADEDRQGRPFVGASGRLLDRMMQSIGLDRAENAYITNILPWRPPGNREPTPAEIATCLPFIRRHIALVKPRLLVPVGGTSAKTLLDQRQGIMRLRGRQFEYTDPALEAPIPAVPFFHPAFLLRSAGQKALAWRDLLTIKQIIQ